MKPTRDSSRAVQLLIIVATSAAISCGGDDPPTGTSPQGVAGQPGAIAGQNAGIAGSAGRAMGPMPGVGTMMMPPPNASAGGPPQAAAGASGAAPSGGVGGVGGLAGAGAGSAGFAGQTGVPAAGSAGSLAGTGGVAGSMAGMAGAAGGMPPADGMDPTSVCMGGKVGMDSDAVMTRGMTSSRNYAVIMYTVKAPNKISRFQTILPVPKVPASRSTLFIWPGLQHSGGADPARVGNGVLQPVLTWGPSCSPKAPRSAATYMGWWISGMYVNISTSAAGPTGCAGGDAMDVGVGDRLYIDFTVKGNEWTQTVLNLANQKKVDFSWDLKGQDQNWAIWDIETPASSRPAEDTYFEKSVLTFTSPVTSCQPTSAPEVDYFSAPVLSPDGLHCCIDKMILKAKRN